MVEQYVQNIYITIRLKSTKYQKQLERDLENKTMITSNNIHTQKCKYTTQANQCIEF